MSRLFRRCKRAVLRVFGWRRIELHPRLEAPLPELDRPYRFLVRRVIDGQEYVVYHGDEGGKARRIFEEYSAKRPHVLELWDDGERRGFFTVVS